MVCVYYTWGVGVGTKMTLFSGRNPCANYQPMNRDNQLLVLDEPVEFEK